MCDLPVAAAADEFPAAGDLELELDDAYERQFEDDLELMRQSEEHSGGNILRQENTARRSLDFSNPTIREKPRRGPSPRVAGEGCVRGGGGKRRRSPAPAAAAAPAAPAAPAHKRHKAERARDEADELTERIVAARRARATPATPAPHAAPSAPAPHTAQLSYHIPRWPFVCVTRGDGARVYVRLAGEADEAWAGAGAGRDVAEHLRLVYAPVWEEARRMLEEKREAEAGAGAGAGVRGEEAARDEEGAADAWADRYRPCSYPHLLSDEPNNRAVLRWLKLWDKIVFNREVTRKEPLRANSFNARAGAWEARRPARGAAGGAPEEAELDEAGAPRRRLLLLCGPPGAGKTTLAHLLASHAGYRPLELNASDDRSVEVFRTALHNATEMQATLRADRRPNCLILDEIDGAPLPTVELLVRFASGTGAGARSGAGKKARAHALRRPVICICNDPWVPALRPLRAAALVLQLPALSAARVAARLGEVAAREGLRAEPAALAALAERAAGDLRSALAALYFLRGAHRQVRADDVKRLGESVGHKDASKGLVQVLQQVLYASDTSSRTLLHSVSALGDYERLASGVFENYLSVGTASVQRATTALDWFRWLDRVQQYLYSTQNYALYPHLPLAFLRWHRLLAARRPHASFLKFPTQAQEMRQAQQRAAGVVAAVRCGAAPALRPYTSHLALTLDLLPLLPHILTPQLRSHNIQLYSERERGELAAVARVMCDYALTYEQTRAADNTYHYTLQPDILCIAFFEGTPAPAAGRRRRLAYAVQQTLAREVTLELMHRAEVKVQAQTAPVRAPTAATTATTTALPNHLQRLQPKRVTAAAATTTHKDFFGRVVVRSGGGGGGGGGGDAPGGGGGGGGAGVCSSSVYYHYREGFNNAVRRAVRLQDML